MYDYLTILVVMTCSAIIVGAQEGRAQSPQNIAADMQIWSDRAHTLHPREPAAGPEMETSPHASRSLPQDLPDQQQTRILLCEPGDSSPTEPAFAAKTDIVERPSEGAR